MTFYIFWNILRMCETSLMKSELDQNRVSQPRSELTLLDSLIWLHVSLAAFSFLTSSGWFVTVSFSLKFESTVLQRRHRRTFYIYFPAASASLWPSIRSGWRRSSAHRWPEAKRVSERREGEQLHRRRRRGRRSVASCCSVLQQTARFFNRVRHRGGEGLMLCSGLHMSLMETSDSWRQIKPVQPAPTRSGRMWVALLTAVRIVIRLRAATQEFTDKSLFWGCESFGAGSMDLIHILRRKTLNRVWAELWSEERENLLYSMVQQLLSCVSSLHVQR